MPERLKGNRDRQSNKLVLKEEVITKPKKCQKKQMSPKCLVKREAEPKGKDRESNVVKRKMNANKLLICMREKQHALAIC